MEMDFAKFLDFYGNEGCKVTPYIYFCTLTVSREDVRAFMAERPEYTKANRFKDIVVKVYI